MKGTYSHANIDGAGTSKKLLKNFYVQVWEGTSSLTTFTTVTGASGATPACATSSKLA